MLEQLKIQTQNKGFKIEHKAVGVLTTFSIRTKDDRVIFHECEIGAEKRFKVHRKATEKLQELLN